MANYHVSTLVLALAAVCVSKSRGNLQTDGTLLFTHKVSTDGGPAVSHDHYGYCNHHKSVTGNEGTEMIGYSLQQVHIVLSPGQSDVSSKAKFQNQSLQPMTCDIQNSSNLKDFKELVDVYPEFSRNHPFHHLHPSFPKVCANDHLTVYGFKQLISIGQHLKTSYFSNRVHKKLQPKYSSVNIESVLTEKSYHSVLGFLFGFLDEKQLYKTKIHESKRNFCVLTESNLSSCMCSKTRELAPYISQALAKGTYMFKRAFPSADKVKEILQTDISDQTSGLELFNTLMQYKCDHESRPPCEGDTVCHMFEEERLERLHEILAEYRHSLHLDRVFRTYSELRVYPFLQQILSRTSQLSDQKPVNVYMGHSHFLQFLTSALVVFRQQITPIASRFVIEVYKKNGGQLGEGDVYLRYLYNGDDVTTEVTGCTFHIENGLCKVTGLKMLVNALRKQYLEQCQ